jgi:hypothetical protein
VRPDAPVDRETYERFRTLTDAPHPYDTPLYYDHVTICNNRATMRIDMLRGCDIFVTGLSRTRRAGIVAAFGDGGSAVRSLVCTFFLVGSVIPLAAHAAESPPMAPQIVALQKCRAEADAAKRLACYDNAANALAAATASQEVVVVERSEVRKARKGLFGFTLPRIGLLAGRDGNKDDEADVKRLDTTIVDARSLANGLWRFTVEGGAVWDTTETSISLSDPKPGRAVRIDAAALGSYMTRIGNGGWVRAKRVQ